LAVLQEPRFQLLEHVIGGLCSRRFLRAPLHRSAKLEAVIRLSIERDSPLEVILLWGKGQKAAPDLAERRATQFLARYATRVAQSWPRGVKYRVFFADTHAAINGYSAAETDRYFRAVANLMGEIGAKYRPLTSLWNQLGLGWRDVSRLAQALDGDAWNRLAKTTGLIPAARRHAPSRQPEVAARFYFAARRLENEALAALYPAALFATSEPPERMMILPSMPVLHLYSFARGRCAKPWHVELPHRRPVTGEAKNACAASRS
jgi:hypothetical protein